MPKKKPAKQKVVSAPLTEAMKRRIATGVTAALCVAAVTFTGVYVFATLNDLDNPGTSEGGTTARVDSVRTELLESALSKNEARRSPERAIPDDLSNPFIAPRSTSSSPAEIPAPTESEPVPTPAP